MSPDEFLVPAGRPILSSTAGWMGESTLTAGLIKLGLMGVGAGVSVGA